MTFFSKKKIVTFLGPLKFANYRNWLIGRLIAVIGEITLTITMPAVVFLLTESLTAWSTVVLLQAITRTLLVLFGGALVDRYKADNILVMISWVQALLAGIFLMLSIIYVIPMWYIWIWAIFNGFILALLYPSINAIIPSLLPRSELMAGNGLYMTFNQVVQLIIPLIVGVVVSFLGTSAAFVIATVAPAFFAIVLMSSIRKEQRDNGKAVASNQKKEKNSLFKNIKQGLLVVKKEKTILTILISLFIFMFGAGLMMHIGLPGLSQLELNGGTQGYGYFVSILAFGAALGSFISGGFKKLKRQGLFAGFLLIGFAAFVFLMSIQTSFLSAGIFLFLAGACWSITAVIYTTLVQLQTPEKNMGSVMALVSLALVGAEPIGFAIAVLIGDSIGARGIMAMAAASIFIGGLIAVLSKTFWVGVQNELEPEEVPEEYYLKKEVEGAND